MTILRGGSNTVAETSAWLDFHDIMDFYELVQVTNVLTLWPDMVQTNRTSGFEIIAPAKLTLGTAKEMAVLIHGWRVDTWDWYNISITMLKRLWWQGYQGRFAALRWPTHSNKTEIFPWMGYITYNRSEHIAFKSGTGTAAYLNDLRSRYPDYKISGCAHSMGGIVTMQALKELAAAAQQPIDNWVLMQAAVPAQCFDTNAPNFQMFLDGEAVAPTPDIYRNYAAGITNALRPGGKIANFFNPTDFALWSWRYNQAFYTENLLGNGVTTIKPNAFMGYFSDGSNSGLRTNVWNTSAWSIIYGGYYVDGPTRTVTNMLELMPFVARPRSLAVGASPNVGGQIQGQQLDLENQLGFGGEPSDHSGEFNRNIQEPQVRPFYSQLKTNLFPQP
jgi:pimeloyl-ACP methyl ester carboxylesterase